MSENLTSIQLDTSALAIKPMDLWGAMLWPLLAFAIWWVAVSQRNNDSIANMTLSIFNLIILVVVILGMQGYLRVRI